MQARPKPKTLQQRLGLGSLTRGRQWHGTASTASNVSEERMSVDPEPENPEDWTQEDAWHLWHGTEFEDNLEGSEPGELFDPNNHIPDVDAYGNEL